MSATADVATVLPARAFTARLLDPLRVFDGCRGQLVITARTRLGIGLPSRWALSPPTRSIPLAILDALRDDLAVEISPATHSGGALADLAALFARWRLADHHTTSADWRHAVSAEDAAKVRAALDSFVPPAFVVDAGPDVVAWWPLDRPLAVDRDPARAVALLSRLAARLGAVVPTDLGAFLPLAGITRNWNDYPPDHVDIIDGDVAARYSIDQLERALDRKGAKT